MAIVTDIGIGRLAALTGVKIPTIRFYEESGLIAPPRRTEGGQRRYTTAAVQRLHFIRHARELGFDMEDIRQLLKVSDHPTMPCDAAEEIARHHLHKVESKIARLRRVHAALKRMIESCRGGAAADCRVLDAIAHEAPMRRLDGP
jgi:DNA-binding transcriptional MerR regulator